MTASFITEKDSAGTDRKVLTELVDTDKHVPAGISYVNGAIVSTANPDPVGGTLLTAIEADDAAILAALQSVIASGKVNVVVASGAATITGQVAVGIPAGAVKRQKELRLTGSAGSTDIWSGQASGKRIAVQSIEISWEGANACRLTIWQAPNADTTFSDTEPKLFDATLDANANGGIAFAYPPGYPWETNAGDDELHVTLSAAKTVWIKLIGDERT